MESRTFAWYKFLQHLMPIYPVYNLLFVRSGLDMAEVSWLLAIWSVPVVLLEVPRGIVADRYSRRKLVLIAALLKALCFLAWVLGQSFGWFAAGFILWGIAEALASGAEEALLFDNLKARGASGTFESVYGKGMAAERIAVAVSCFSGGLLAQWLGFDFVLLCSAATGMASFLVAMTFKEPYREHIASEPLHAGIRTGLVEVYSHTVHTIRHRRLLTTVVLVVLAVGMAGILDEYDPLIAERYGFSLAVIGYWVGTRYLIEALGASLAHRIGSLGLLKGNDGNGAVWWMCGMAAVNLSMVGLFDSLATLPLYALFYGAMAVAQVLQENRLQQCAVDEGRATLHSLVSLATNVHAMVFFGIAGIIVGQQNPGVIVLFSSVYLVGVLLVVACVDKVSNRNNRKR